MSDGFQSGVFADWSEAIQPGLGKMLRPAHHEFALCSSWVASKDALRSAHWIVLRDQRL